MSVLRLELPLNGWAPRDYQLAAWGATRNPAIRTIVLNWSRRMGKDAIALHSTAVKAMERVGNYWHMLPMQEQARKALWEAVNPHTGKIRWQEAFGEDPKTGRPSLIEHVDNESMKLRFKNGSTWQLVGSNNHASLVGATPVGLISSETALEDPTAFAYLRPILLENNGWSMHISTPRGKNHFYHRFMAYKDAPDAFVQKLNALESGVFTPAQLAQEMRNLIAEHGEAMGRALFEQEYMGSWEAAVLGAVWGPEINRLEIEGRLGDWKYDSRYPVDTSWDIGVNDTNVILFFQTSGNQVRLIDYYAANNIGLDHYAEVLASKSYYYGRHIGPHDIAVREWGANALSRVEMGKKLGLYFERMPNIPKADSIAAASALFNRMVIDSSCAPVLEMFKAYHYTYNKELKVMSKSPAHGPESHYADALMTYAIWAIGSSMKGQSRAQTLQGRGHEADHFDKMRLTEVLQRAHALKARGAWG